MPVPSLACKRAVCLAPAGKIVARP
jgi:hypothetical protein